MQKRDGLILFSPTDLTTFFKSPFASWMDRAVLENPSDSPKPEADETLKLLGKKGDEHEAAYLKIIQSKYKEIAQIDKALDFEKAHALTVKAMKDGAPVIYQGALKKGNIAGYSDFLVKVEGKSRLGSHHYEAWDTKLSKVVKPEYVIQLCAYSEMLAEIQGVLPSDFAIVLGDQRVERLKISEFIFYFDRFQKRFEKYHSDFSLKNMPIPQPWESFGVWEERAIEELKRRDHLYLVANISAAQINRLEGAGINSKSKLASLKTSDCLDKMEPRIFEKLVTQAKLQIESEKLGKPTHKVLEYEDGEIFGLARLPEPNDGDIYFDMEGYPLMEGGLEYLFGVCFKEKSKWVYKDWWALDKSQEKTAFEGFIDWVFAKWRKNRNLKIYHYAAYEVSATKRLMGSYMTREHEVDELLRNGVFVDLYKVVREGLVVGEESYSIKKLERHYDFKRSSDVKQGADSIVQFANWLEVRDGKDCSDSKILNEIRDYNKDDCKSTVDLATWLRQIQKDAGIKYSTVEGATDETELADRRESDVLADELMTNLPKDNKKAQMQTVLAGCLGYHRREAKPQWWAYFERQGSRPEDLIDDLDCLADCEVTSQRGSQVRIKFNISQETKLKAGDDFQLLHDNSIKGTLTSIEIGSGEATLEIRVSGGLPPKITLLPTGPFNTRVIEDAIFDTVSDWASSRGITIRPALKILLEREAPTIKGVKQGSNFYSDDSEPVSTAIKLSMSLENSVLAIQGPPGTGKTYTASQMIAELIKAGHRIGVTSNSHKAINLLLEKSFEALKSIGLEKTTQIYKVQSEVDAELVRKIKCNTSKSASEFWRSRTRSFHLVGGTSWFFANERSQDQFDYLFIEEAGQFSLANAVAVQRSASNLVLLGDQMQLEQPVQGSHPEGIAESVLGYYLHGHATVPPHMGVFLGKSRRMRPEVCEFISTTFYEGRLRSHEVTKDNKIDISKSKFIGASEGIVFLEVSHEGNSQGSIEEAELIKTVVTSLKGAIISGEKDGKREFSLNDVLLVAPYNLQVGYLTDALGKKARIGSVDLFQGQEAPIVVLSMCSSDGESSPRGLEFLLNLNRINVAISRAKTLAIIVGNPAIADAKVSNIKNMRLINLFCKIITKGIR